MEALRASAAAQPAGAALSWSRAGAESTDELADWTLKLGSAALYKVHTAVVASGSRGAEKLRAQALKAAKGEGGRTTDVLQLITSETARAAIQKDPHAASTVEALLSWMYGLASDFALPSLGGPGAVGAPVAKSLAGATDGGMPPRPAPLSKASATEGSVLDMFSTAIFGTPTKGGGDSAGRAAPSSGSARRLDVAANGGSAGPKALVLKPEQLPLLWQLGDALGVRGLKARLLPVFEASALAPHFTP